MLSRNLTKLLFSTNTSALKSRNFVTSSMNGTQYTLQNIVGKWRDEFIKSEIPDAHESAEEIVGHVLKKKKVSDFLKFKDALVTSNEATLIEELCKQRLKRLPVQYITQEWDFRDLTLKMSRPVFIPWPETEMLIDVVLKGIDEKKADRFLEFCCGSGAITLALLKSRPNLRAVAVDKSSKACELTKENAQATQLSSRLEIIQAVIGKDALPIKETSDVIVSNAPYVPKKELERMRPECLLYEDLAALNGGEDGLDVIKTVVKASASKLNYGGKLFLEVHPTHPSLIKAWLEKNDGLGLKFVAAYKDFAEKDRYVEIIKSE